MATAPNISFVRHLDVGYELCMVRLTNWLERTGTGSVSAGRSYLTLPPGAESGWSHFDVSLPRGRFRPPLPMELDVIRWSAAFGTLIELHPTRGMRPDDRYYREGNAFLDRLTDVVTGRA